MMPFSKTTTLILARLIVILISVAIFYPSCRNSPIDILPDKPILAKDSIMALNVGNRWIWQTTLYDTLGKPYSTYHDSLRIDSVQVINSENWYFPGQPYGDLAFANLVGGCYYRAFTSNTPGPSFLFYKYPATLNESYKAPQGLVSGSHVWIVDSLRMMTVLSTDTTVTISAGTFHGYLYRYAMTNGFQYSEEFLAPGRGWVRILTYVRIRDGVYFKQSSKELIKFIPGS